MIKQKIDWGNILADLCMGIGLCAIVVGVAMVNRPAAVIVLGLILVVIGILTALGRERKQTR